MDKIGPRSGDQYLHRKTDQYRAAIRRKLAAYHRFIQIALISQGVLQCIAATTPALVWSCFGSWLCTVRPGIPPSEPSGRDDRSPKFTPRFSHRFRSRPLVEEIPA